MWPLTPLEATANFERPLSIVGFDAASSDRWGITRRTVPVFQTMKSDHLYRFLLTQGVWMLAALAVLVALGLFVLETYFVVSFIGLIVVMQLYAPTDEPPDWWRLLRLLVVVCFLIFGFIIYRRFVAVL